MSDKRRANVNRDGFRKAVTIGIYSEKHKILYDLFYDEKGNLRDGKKPASDIPAMCIQHILGEGNMEIGAIVDILLRIEAKISKLKSDGLITEAEADEVDENIEDFLAMTSFIE